MKKLISFIGMICLVLSLIPTTIKASPTTLTDLTIADIDVVLGGVVQPTTSGTGWSYAEGVLTLDGININSGDYDTIIAANGDLTIEVVGTSNSIINTNVNNNSPSTISTSGILTIRGSGSLSVAVSQLTIGYSNSNPKVIYSDGLIVDGATVNANMNNISCYGVAINSEGDVLIQNGATININNIISGGYYLDGLSASGIITVNDSTLNVNITGDEGDNPYGIYGYGLTVNNSKVYSETVNCYRAYAITLNGDLNISNGSEVKGITNFYESYGVDVDGDINVNNSTLYGEGDKYGIYVDGDNEQEGPSFASEETNLVGGNIIINITNSAYKVEGLATGEAIEENNEEEPSGEYDETGTYLDNDSDDVSYSYLPMAILAKTISYNSEAKILTPVDGILNPFYDGISIFATNEDDFPTLHAIIGVEKQIVPETTQPETTQPVTTQPQTTRPPVVAGSEEVVPASTGDQTSPALMLCVLLIAGSVVSLTMLVKKVKKA